MLKHLWHCKSIAPQRSCISMIFRGQCHLLSFCQSTSRLTGLLWRPAPRQWQTCSVQRTAGARSLRNHRASCQPHAFFTHTLTLIGYLIDWLSGWLMVLVLTSNMSKVTHWCDAQKLPISISQRTARAAVRVFIYHSDGNCCSSRDSHSWPHANGAGGDSYTTDVLASLTSPGRLIELHNSLSDHDMVSSLWLKWNKLYYTFIFQHFYYFSSHVYTACSPLTLHFTLSN